MNYGYPEKRKSKKDLRKKRKSRAYKRGGKFRTMNVSETQGEKKKQEEKK